MVHAELQAAVAAIMKSKPLTKAQRDLLELATRSPDGNPWRMLGIQARTGGAKRRMFDEMQRKGLFDSSNRITAAGRAALGKARG